MADLKIPKLNMNSDKYIFKKKLTLRRKSKRRLIVESLYMLFLSLLLVYINYLIPNKNLLVQDLPSTLNKSFLLSVELISYFYKIFLLIFILISTLVTLILMIGSLYRLFKVFRRKTKQLNF